MTAKLEDVVNKSFDYIIVGALFPVLESLAVLFTDRTDLNAQVEV